MKRLIISIVLTCLFVPFEVWGMRAVIRADADATVTKVRGDINSGDKVILAAGISQSPQRGPSRTYIRFDLSNIPATLLTKEIAIESAELRLFAQSTALVGKDDRRFLVTVGHCLGEWDEHTITWNSQPCEDTTLGADTQVIDGNDFPRVYSWNVTQSVSDVLVNSAPKISFVIDALSFKVGIGSRDIVSEARQNPRVHDQEKDSHSVKPGFVRLWSRERDDFGASAVPTLIVDYSTRPTVFAQAVGTFLSVLSAIGVVVGLYEGVRAMRRNG